MKLIKTSNESKNEKFLSIISDALNYRYLPKGYEVIFRSKENKVYDSISDLYEREGLAYLRNSKDQQILAIAEFDKSDVKSYYTEDDVYVVNVRQDNLTDEYKAGWNACVQNINAKLPRMSKKNEDFLEGFSDCEYMFGVARAEAIKNATNPVNPVEI